MIRQGDWILLGYQNPPMPYQETYNRVDLALVKPAPGQPRYSQWGFQQGHMNFILEQEPRYFELYNIRSDPRQTRDLSEKHPERASAMRREMIALRQQILQDGEIWQFSED